MRVKLALLAFAVLAACPGEEADQGTCLPTLGDKCGCIPQCMTQQQLDSVIGEGVCDLECETGTALAWTCEVVDGECAVAD